MRLAKHLAVLGFSRPALTPRGHMVSVHLIESIDLCLHTPVAERTERTVRLALRLGGISLTLVRRLLGRLVEDAHIKEVRFLLPAEEILPDPCTLLQVAIAVERLDFR